jgi:hypothetical protein
MKNFKIDVFIKKLLGVYLVKYFGARNGVLGYLQAISPGNCPFFHCFRIGWHVGVFNSFDSLHHHALPGHFPRQ